MGQEGTQGSERDHATRTRHAVLYNEYCAFCVESRMNIDWKNGGESQNRTGDTRIFSPLLYQLSYLAQKRKFEIRNSNQPALPGNQKSRRARAVSNMA